MNAAILVLALFAIVAQAQTKLTLSPAVKIGKSDIGGVVSGMSLSGPARPEAGAWVIAETTDLPTKLAKIVVTDDKGRYVIPDLPKASYSVWVRGYGLVDSEKVKAAPGRIVNLRAVPAPSAKEAAEYYPALYWFALLKVPAAGEFPLGPVREQGAWLNTIKSGACQSCHALGTPGMRTVPEFFSKGRTSHEAWRERLRAGSAQALMARDLGRLDAERAIANFADWTERIAKGELPFERPARPQGVERNLVITTWDWLAPQFYLHELVSTDRRDPTVNAGGPVYGSPEDSTDLVPVLDPRSGRSYELEHPVRDAATPSVKMDELGRIWFTSRIAPDPNPEFCKSGSAHASAQAFPLNGGANRHLSYYDPAKKEWRLIRTCFPTHYLNFAGDASQTLWTSAGVAGPGVIGWLDRKLYEATGDEQRAQGWSPFVLDTSGDGRRSEYTHPDQPFDGAKDRRVAINLYAVAVSPADGTIWGTAIGYPGYVVRVAPGSDPTNTALTELYEPPLPGFGPRGGDVDLDGVYWVALASGHLGQFDRRICKVTNGATATGAHCPEGWKLHVLPGPQLRDVKTPGSAEAPYYAWVDTRGILGLGRNVPIVMGNLGDAILPFVEGRFVTLRLPYPSGVFPKNVDGRIDDYRTGWKGRALWTTSGTRTNFHLEGGRENRPKAIRLQMRPDPLAR